MVALSPVRLRISFSTESSGLLLIFGLIVLLTCRVDSLFQCFPLHSIGSTALTTWILPYKIVVIISRQPRPLGLSAFSRFQGFSDEVDVLILDSLKVLVDVLETWLGSLGLVRLLLRFGLVWEVSEVLLLPQFVFLLQSLVWRKLLLLLNVASINEVVIDNLHIVIPVEKGWVEIAVTLLLQLYCVLWILLTWDQTILEPHIRQLLLVIWLTIVQLNSFLGILFICSYFVAVYWFS